MLSHTLIVIHTFDSQPRGCSVAPWSFAHSFGSRCQCWLCNAHLFLSVFRVIFPLRSFHFVFLPFFLLRCLLCAFAAASQLGPALILLIFKLGDASPCLFSPFLLLFCPVPACLSVCRPGPCVLRFIFTLKRTRAETYKWQPLARMDPSFPEFLATPIPRSAISVSFYRHLASSYLWAVHPSSDQVRLTVEGCHEITEMCEALACCTTCKYARK